MISCRDPGEMTEDQRLREIAEILARGYLRLLADRGKGLAMAAAAEALSSNAVNGAGAATARRSA